MATLDQQRAELEREQANFVAVIAKLESPDAAGPIAAKLNLIAKQLQGCERNRADILARQAMWQRDQQQIDDVLATCRHVAEDMAVLRTWTDRRAMAQKLRVRFELFPADHAPRWVASSEIVPDVMMSERSQYDSSTCTNGPS